MQDVDALARVHPYVVPPSARQGGEWVLCGLLGSVLGFCCVNPDGGDYGQWTALVHQALDKWRGPFSQRGLLLSLQNHRDYWIQIDVQNVAQGYPTGCV
ncbi:hypothetical protein WJX81_000067 [Elliptochloris bilobata]|uniref:Uncharacterized protein n=1 Tax=Elliptochloris bilobata TaxID=381761 RepID=A0AAW1SCK5_9CHLO